VVGAVFVNGGYRTHATLERRHLLPRRSVGARGGLPKLIGQTQVFEDGLVIHDKAVAEMLLEPIVELLEQSPAKAAAALRLILPAW
jgi:hypothetical protein